MTTTRRVNSGVVPAGRVDTEHAPPLEVCRHPTHPGSHRVVVVRGGRGKTGSSVFFALGPPVACSHARLLHFLGGVGVRVGLTACVATRPPGRQRCVWLPRGLCTGSCRERFPRRRPCRQCPRGCTPLRAAVVLTRRRRFSGGAVCGVCFFSPLSQLDGYVSARPLARCGCAGRRRSANSAAAPVGGP